MRLLQVGIRVGAESNWKSLKIVLGERMTVCERVGGYAWFKTRTIFVMSACRKICRDLTALSLLELGVFSTCSLSVLQRNYHRLEVFNAPLVCKKKNKINNFNKRCEALCNTAKFFGQRYKFRDL